MICIKMTNVILASKDDWGLVENAIRNFTGRPNYSKFSAVFKVDGGPLQEGFARTIFNSRLLRFIQTKLPMTNPNRVSFQ